MATWRYKISVLILKKEKHFTHSLHSSEIIFNTWREMCEKCPISMRPRNILYLYLYNNWDTMSAVIGWLPNFELFCRMLKNVFPYL